MLDTKKKDTFRDPVPVEMQDTFQDPEDLQLSFQDVENPQEPADRNEKREESIKSLPIQMKVEAQDEENEDEVGSQDEENEDDSESWDSSEEEPEEMNHEDMATIYMVVTIIIICGLVGIGFLLTNGYEKSTPNNEISESMETIVSVTEIEEMKEVDHKDVDEYALNVSSKESAEEEETGQEDFYSAEQKIEEQKEGEIVLGNKTEKEAEDKTRDLKQGEEREGTNQEANEVEENLEVNEEVEVKVTDQEQGQVKPKEDSDCKKRYRYWFYFFILATVILGFIEMVYYAIHMASNKKTKPHFYIPDSFFLGVYGGYCLLTLFMFFLYCRIYECPFACKCNNDSKTCCKDFVDILTFIAFVLLAVGMLAGRIAMKLTTSGNWTIIDLKIAGVSFFCAFCLFIVIAFIKYCFSIKN